MKGGWQYEPGSIICYSCELYRHQRATAQTVFVPPELTAGAAWQVR